MAPEAHINDDLPALYSNGSSEDLEALMLLKESGIDCDYFGPVLGHPTPHLIWRYRDYIGLEEIKGFIQEYRAQQAA